MQLNTIYNMNCLELMQQMDSACSDVILTSPPYNTNKKGSANVTTNTVPTKQGEFTYARYDGYNDNLTNDEYCDFIEDCFKGFDRVLRPNGVILWNASYGNENANAMFLALNRIIQTGFTIADVITWKKKSALPDNQSPNKATRICEFVYVIVRSTEYKTFRTNKKVSSTRPTGQKMYSPFYNFIEAPNNDGKNDLNKATFSTKLVSHLLELYAPNDKETVVFDPFIGTGTAAVGAIKLGMQYIGSEISAAQVNYSNERIKAIQGTAPAQNCTFASSDTQADALACKRAVFLPTHHKIH